VRDGVLQFDDDASWRGGMSAGADPARAGSEAGDDRTQAGAGLPQVVGRWRSRHPRRWPHRHAPPTAPRGVRTMDDSVAGAQTMHKALVFTGPQYLQRACNRTPANKRVT
jgi:hypothetical protein